MKTLLYIAFNSCTNQLFGVNAKISAQCRAFAQYGYRVDLIKRRAADTVLLRDGEQMLTLRAHRALLHHPYIRSVADKRHQLRDVAAYIRGKSYDACYIRYDFSDPGFIRLLRRLRRVCTRIVVELPTYPYEDENRAACLSRVKLAADMLWRRRLHRYVDSLVTFYGGYERLFGIPVQVVPNGFDFAGMTLAQSPLPSDGIHIIAVSSMREWHGYERFIEGMRSYYRDGEKNKRRIVFHLVGHGREYGKYKALIEAYGLEEHVILEGAMHGAPLDALYARCALGVDSLARHRTGIDVLSSLKSREYGAKGLPMINSCRIDVIGDDFPYLLLVPADETPIDMRQVIAFYDRCYRPGLHRCEVGREIRRYMEARCGMEQTLREVVRLFDA